MAVVQLLVFLTVAGLATGRNFNLQNNLGYTIWVGILGNGGKWTPENGGFVLNGGERRTVDIADGWGGRFWARTGCNFDGNGQGPCETGDCGNKLSCNGAGGVPPVTLAEITLNGDSGLDFYDVSLVDGFNVPVQMRPTRGGGNGYSCTTAGCNSNLNPGCPDDLKVWEGDNVVACKSSCVAHNSDEYCCRGAFNNPNVCRRPPSGDYFKTNCPGACSYAYDDKAITFTCQNTDYDIIFG
uniref:Thaumatin-like protein 1 n=1 Tax=Coptotermes formosanus TaxID=36987 RepID=L0CMP2_COPFO|nr:thaumatin-like protein 1 [Coptotermes formosanus]